MVVLRALNTTIKVRQIQILSNDAREIVRSIASALGWKIHETAEGISAYSPSKALRIADHRTYMQTWVDNGSWNKPIKADVVIEDEPTKGATMVRIGYDFTIPEFVHLAENMTPEIAKSIAFDLKQSMENRPYANNARGQGIMLKSTHTNTTQQNNNENINCNRNMKNRIRLTESQLHRVIKESVNKVLNEQNEYTVDNPYEIYLPNRGETYYVWETLGDFYGSSDIESQRGNITNARKKQIFRASQGFETIDDVEQYVLKYFDR